jgi:hypothetical protein
MDIKLNQIQETYINNIRRLTFEHEDFGERQQSLLEVINSNLEQERAAKEHLQKIVSHVMSK